MTSAPWTGCATGHGSKLARTTPSRRSERYERVLGRPKATGAKGVLPREPRVERAVAAILREVPAVAAGRPHHVLHAPLDPRVVAVLNLLPNLHVPEPFAL